MQQDHLHMFLCSFFFFSELVTPFQIESPEPFHIDPVQGVLEPFTSASINATFKPKVSYVEKFLLTISCHIPSSSSLGPKKCGLV